MLVAGIDVSSLAVDVVWLDVDDQKPPRWQRWKLEGPDAWERCRHLGTVFPGAAWSGWDDTLAIGIEVAFGPSSGDVNRCVGAVLSRLPIGLLVERWSTSQWRKAIGLFGSASKKQVFDYVLDTAFREGWRTDERNLVQDACDAYCIALATRQAIEQQAA
jgi:hypothetical protein